MERAGIDVKFSKAEVDAQECLHDKIKIRALRDKLPV